MTGTQYPNFIDSFAQLPLLVDGVNQVRADDVNRVRNAIVAVETELGTNPSGVYGTVADRLDVLEAGGGGGGGGTGTVEGTGVADRLAYWLGTDELTSSSALTFASSVFKVDAATVFNESGADVDFRIASDTNANMLFVDGGTNRVGINTGTPGFLFDVEATGATTAQTANLRVNNQTNSFYAGAFLSSNAGDLVLRSNGTTVATTFLGESDAATAMIVSSATNGLKIGTESASKPVKLGTNAIVRQTLTDTEVVFNDLGNDYDFRVESDGDANMLFVDAGNNRIGIGTNSPTSVVDVLQTGNATNYISLRNTSNGAGSGLILAENGAGGLYSQITYLNSAASSGVPSFTSGSLLMQHAGAGRMLLMSASGPFTGGEIMLATGGFDNDRQRLRITDGGGTSGAGGIIVINEGGIDFDFRIEGDTDSNLVFVDASADQFSIGSGSPITGTKTSLTATVTGQYAASYRASSGDDTLVGWYNSSTALLAINGLAASNNALITGSIAGDYVFRSQARKQLFSTDSGVTSSLTIDVSAGEVVINESGTSTTDFRVEGDTQSNLLFIDASADAIGIGTSAPSTVLHIDSNAANTVAILTLENTAGNIQVFRTDATPQSAVTGSIGDIAIDSTAGTMYLKTSGTSTNTGWTDVLAGSGGANVTLSNLGTTEINTDLLPDTDATWNLGSPDLRWKDGYFGPDSIHLSSTIAERGSAGHWQIKLGNADISEEVDNTLVFQALEVDGYAGKISFSADGSLRTLVTDDEFAFFGGDSDEPIEFTLRNQGTGEFSGVRLALFNDDEGALINFLTATTWTPEEPGGIDYPDTAIIGATTSNGMTLFGAPLRIGNSFTEDDLVARFDGYTTLQNIDGYTSPVLRLQNADGYMAVYLTQAEPEDLIDASPGSLAIDTLNGILYIKQDGDSAAGWVSASNNRLTGVEQITDLVVDLDFSGKVYKSWQANGSVTIDGANYTPGHSISVRIENISGGLISVSVIGLWGWAGEEPVQLADGEVGLLSAACWGTTEDLVAAAWVVLS